MNRLKLIFILAIMFVFVSIGFGDSTDHYVINTTSSVANQTFENYFQTSDSGGVFFITSSGNLTISSSSFINNTTVLNSSSTVLPAGGGVIYNQGGILNIGNNIVFSSNSVSGVNNETGGGAIANIYGAITIGNNVIFSSNSAAYCGGAIANIGEITIGDNALFNSNSAYDGGAIFNTETSTTTISNGAKFTNNVAVSSGGAIYNDAILNIADNVLFSSNSADCGGAIASSGTITIGNNVIFSSNSADCYGGAIANLGEVTIGDNIIFLANSADSEGGAIDNYGELTIGNNALFSSNSSAIAGGAIVNMEGTVTVGDNVIFSSNTANYGGAIANAYGEINIGDNIIFSSNTSADIGGAIYNTAGGDIQIGDNAIFNNNFARTYDGNKRGYGGAIFNNTNSKITIGSDSVFTSNNVYKNGGAINNYQGSLILGSNAIFDSNKAYNSGGAIYNVGTLTILDGAQFTNNTATTNGGAIYNEGKTINLVANTNNIEFTGNTANGVSNAINSGGGTINLWASENADVIFNDRIKGSGTTNINKSTTTLTANGKIVLNEDMSGYTGKVNLYNGEIELQAKKSGNVNTNKFFSGDINLSSGTLNILNNAIDNITVSNFTSTENSNLKFDANLSAINLLGVNEDSGQITLFKNTKSPTLNILTSASYGGYEYTFTNSGTTGVLNYERGAELDLKNAVNKTEPPIRSYSLAGNETVTEDLGQLGGEQLTIFGNGYEVDGNGKAGINVSNGQIVFVEKGIGEDFIWENFSKTSEGGAFYVTSGATLNLGSNINFSTNSSTLYGGAIYNNGDLNIEDNGYYYNNLAQVGGALLNFESGIINVSSSNYFENNRATNGEGGAIENVGTLSISSGTKFVLNEANTNGGAISNAMYINGDFVANANIGDYVLFSSNTANYGGGLSNISAIAIIGNNNIFEYNMASSEGGAIYNTKNDYKDVVGQITISSNTKFLNNTATNLGGAIFNNSGIITIYSTASFTNNSSDLGGAIYNSEGMINIGTDSSFKSNYTTTNGGAIFNQSNGIINVNSNAEFSNNETKYAGGAIYNYDGTINFDDAILFSSNTARHGGAIDNRAGIITFSDGVKFSFNNAVVEDNPEATVGGAIFNLIGGTINLVAKTNNIEFTGNKANGISNAIHDYNGTINLWASDSADIIFNDRITSEDNTSVLNINKSSNTLPTTGTVVLNENMSGYTGSVNLYGGTLKLTENGTFFNANTLNLSSGTLDVFNNKIDNITVANFSSTTNANLMIDANLNNSTSDNFTVAGSATGTLEVSKINVTDNSSSNTGYITLFNNTKAPTLNSSAVTFTSDGYYSFSSSTTLGLLNYAFTECEAGLNLAVSTTIPTVRNYSLNKDENITIALGQLGGTELTIFGNNYDIIGNDVAGIMVGQGQILNIIGVKSYEGFNAIFSGGVIANEYGEITIGDNVLFNSNSANVHGGAIYNYDGELNIGDNVLFSSNSSAMAGGAIVNIEGSVTVGDNVIFSSNTADFGGAIANADGEITIGDNIIFSSNSANMYGGAIDNEYEAIITIGNNVIFSSNSADHYGGAIYNGGELTIGHNVIFNSNSADSVGGAIANSGELTIGDNAIFSSNYAMDGGAIYNYNDGVITIGDNVLFSSNSADSVGGAIENYGEMSIGDNVIFSSNSANANGGAIINIGKLTTIGKNALFSSNFANSLGGAISTIRELTFQDGAKFTNNVAVSSGGAIYNTDTLNLIADTNNIEFTGNTANGISNAIHDGGGTINLWAGKGSIIFNDRITSENTTSVININQSSGTLPTTGTVILNEDMEGFLGNVNFKSGKIQLGNNGTLFNNFTVSNGATFDFADSVIKNYSFKNLTVSNGLANITIDADLANESMDTISADNYSGTGKMDVNKINIITDSTKINTDDVIFTTSTILKDNITATTTAIGPLYNYNVVYSTNTGSFNFTRGVVNPIVLEGAVSAMAGGCVTQVNVLGQAFNSIDGFVNSSRISAKKHSNLYASTANQIFEINNKIERGLWLRPYAIQETVKLGNIDIDNISYGTLAGLDLAVTKDKMVSFYLGYTGSKQEYEKIKANQTGYIVGASGMLVKDNYYIALTANVGFNDVNADNDYGTDKFKMMTYSVGAKAGYDIEAGKNWIIQPNLLLMYGMVKTDEYTTSQGAKVDSTSTNNIHIEPQVKAKLDLENGWTPYGLVGVAFNAGDKAKTTSEGTDLESMSFDSYVEYGAGVNKSFIGTSWSGYGQVTGRSGGRNGYGLFAGVKYSF